VLAVGAAPLEVDAAAVDVDAAPSDVGEEPPLHATSPTARARARRRAGDRCIPAR